MTPFEELVIWLANQGVNPDVAETEFGWRLYTQSLRVDWSLDNDFTLAITGRGKKGELTLQEVQDEIEGWFV